MAKSPPPGHFHHASATGQFKRMSSRRLRPPTKILPQIPFKALPAITPLFHHNAKKSEQLRCPDFSEKKTNPNNRHAASACRRSRSKAGSNGAFDEQFD
jgi:hypothetical protein